MKKTSKSYPGKSFPGHSNPPPPPMSKSDIADSIEHIFKNEERIHGKSESIDWIKLAAHKAASYLIRTTPTTTDYHMRHKHKWIEIYPEEKEKLEHLITKKRKCTECGKVQIKYWGDVIWKTIKEERITVSKEEIADLIYKEWFATNTKTPKELAEVINDIALRSADSIKKLYE
jgi:hypothetical protein